MNTCGIPEVSRIGSWWKLWTRRYAATVEVPCVHGLELDVGFTHTKRGARAEVERLKREKVKPT